MQHFDVLYFCPSPEHEPIEWARLGACMSPSWPAILADLARRESGMFRLELPFSSLSQVGQAIRQACLEMPPSVRFKLVDDDVECGSTLTLHIPRREC